LPGPLSELHILNVAISHYFPLQIWRLLQQNSEKNLFGQLACDFFNLLCGYSKTRQIKREKNTASKVPMDDTTAVFEPEEKNYCFKKRFVAKCRNLANLFSLK